MIVDPRHDEHSFNLPFWRDNNKLWALDVPTEEMGISELLWIIDVPFWEDNDGNIVIIPKDVIENPNLYPEHIERVHKSDLSFPLDIMKNKNDMWLTLDGLHRLVKHILLGNKKIPVRKIPKEIIYLTARDN